VVLSVLSYTNCIGEYMSPQHTLTAIKEFCKKNSGDETTWTNKSTTYQWNIGRSTATGLVNGVVRKLAGIDASGLQIWVVAGSLKIEPAGNISRWTGLPRETQKIVEGVARITAESELKVGT
jgi:hypothetical protein